MAETPRRDTADVLERLVAMLGRYNDVRESQRPPPPDEDPPAVSLPEERLSQH